MAVALITMRLNFFLKSDVSRFRITNSIRGSSDCLILKSYKVPFSAMFQNVITQPRYHFLFFF